MKIGEITALNVVRHDNTTSTVFLTIKTDDAIFKEYLTVKEAIAHNIAVKWINRKVKLIANGDKLIQFTL